MTAPLDSARAAWAAQSPADRARVLKVLTEWATGLGPKGGHYRAAIAVLEAAAVPKPRTLTIAEAREMALATLARCEAARTEEPPSGAGTDGREAGR